MGLKSLWNKRKLTKEEKKIQDLEFEAVVSDKIDWSETLNKAFEKYKAALDEAIKDAYGKITTPGKKEVAENIAKLIKLAPRHEKTPSLFRAYQNFEKADHLKIIEKAVNKRGKKDTTEEIGFNLAVKAENVALLEDIRNKNPEGSKKYNKIDNKINKAKQQIKDGKSWGNTFYEAAGTTTNFLDGLGWFGFGVGLLVTGATVVGLTASGAGMVGAALAGLGKIATITTTASVALVTGGASFAKGYFVKEDTKKKLAIEVQDALKIDNAKKEEEIDRKDLESAYKDITIADQNITIADLKNNPTNSDNHLTRERNQLQLEKQKLITIATTIAEKEGGERLQKVEDLQSDYRSKHLDTMGELQKITDLVSHFNTNETYEDKEEDPTHVKRGLPSLILTEIKAAKTTKEQEQGQSLA